MTLDTNWTLPRAASSDWAAKAGGKRGWVGGNKGQGFRGACERIDVHWEPHGALTAFGSPRPHACALTKGCKVQDVANRERDHAHHPRLELPAHVG